MSDYSISIVIPVYNEEEIIESSVLKNLYLLNSSNVDYEIIIVNDGSFDRSGEIIQKLSESYNVKVIEHTHNMGFGAAIRTGIHYSEKDYILCVPADSPLEKENFFAFKSNFGVADILVSYRRKRLGYTWWMHLNSIIYHKLITFLFDMNLKDYNWIHMYHRRVFLEGKVNIEYDGIFMLAEVLIKAQRYSYTFVEFPVDQTQRITGDASAAKLKNIIRTLKELLHFYLKKSADSKNNF